MEITYQGKDITGYVIPNACIYRDVSHGKADTLDISFSRAASWHRWSPKADDKIQVTEGRLNTGELYVNTIVPTGNEYRILASSLPSTAMRKAWANYKDITLSEIMHRCAVECKMGDGLYGIDGNILYPFLMRQNEGCAAFLEKLARCEGIALKAWGGNFRGIGIEYAQGLNTARSWKIDAEQEGIKYQHQAGQKYASLTVKSPWAEATAKDSGAKNGSQIIISDLPAMDETQAGRWARGLLLSHNREAERFSMQTKLDPAASAMLRATITGDTDASGDWLIDEAEHDIYKKKTTVKMLRIIKTIS